MSAAAWAVIALSILFSIMLAISIVTAWQRISDLIRDEEEER